MSNLNKNSIASVISDFADNIEKNILEPNEALSASPASFVGSLSSTLGKISAYTYYNAMMSKREIQPSTAIMMKSLLRHLKSDELSHIYATPSSLGFILSYPEEQLIKSAKLDSSGKYKLTLNKDTTFYVGDKPTFKLDYNVDIYISKYTIDGKVNTSIYAQYDVDDVESGDIDILKKQNAFITTRNDVVLDGVRYFTMYLDVHQYDRTYNTYDLSGENRTIVVPFNDELIGFVVLYKGQSASNWSKINAYLEGESQSNGVNYSISSNGTQNNVVMRFSKLPGAFNPNNGTIKVVTYTTKGVNGNFKFDSTSDESIDNADLNITLAQDLSDIYQEALVNLIPSGTLKSCSASGGSNAKSLEEIRSIVTAGATSSLITPSEIESAAEKKGFESFKYRDDLHSTEYILYGFMQDAESNILPTKMIDLTYLYDEIALNTETSSRIISPSDTFVWDDAEKLFVFKRFENSDSYSEYYDKYKSKSTDQMAFPYFIRIQNGSSMNVSAFDESIDFTSSTKMEFLSNTILDKASIVSGTVYRNPLDLTVRETNGTDTKYMKDCYRITFAVNTSSALVTHLKNLSSSDNAYMKIRLVFKNRSDTSKYVADVDLSNCEFDEVTKTILCNVYIDTNSALLSSNKIAIINNSITKLPYTSTPYSFYYIDGEIDMEFAIIFKNTDGTPISNKYSEYLTPIEVIDNYYVGVVYSMEDIVLSKDVTDTINIIPDIKLTQPVYKVADSDVADTYSEDVYKTSGGVYDIINIEKELPDGSTSNTKSYVTIHKAGDIKKEYDGRVGSYNILSNGSWVWSDDSSNTPGIYNDGSVLGNVAIYAMCQWDGLVIFAGEDGRVGCFDSKVDSGKWYSYDSSDILRTGANNTKHVIRNDGSAMDKKPIRGMKVVKVTSNNLTRDVLIVYGDNGYVASCDLNTNTWRKFDGSSGNSYAIFHNNGSGTGNENIYACDSYTISSGHEIIVFAGGSGRVCSLDTTTHAWYPYNTTSVFSSSEHPYSDGSVMGYKAILTMSKYLDSIIYMSGIDGKVSTLDIPTGTFAAMNDGSVIGKVPVYSSAIVNGVYVIAGKGGRVASYSISKNMWSTYNQDSGLASDGLHIGDVDINAVMGYDVNVIFAGGDGRICSYNIVTNEWTPYTSSIGMANEGNFIRNTISAIAFDSTESNIIYFAGKAGNIVYKYRKGDRILDENGRPVVEVPSKQVGYLKGIPAFSRLFSVSSKFDEVVKAYNVLLENVHTLSGIFPSGCSLFAGVKTTTGKSSSFKFKNLSTGEEHLIDALDITFKAGVKFDDSVTDSNKIYLVSSIKTKINEYVHDIQRDTSKSSRIELNVDEMLNHIKDEVPNIKYFEFYGINDYSSMEVQTIYCDRTELSGDKVSEYLSIKNEVDESSSDIANREITLKPAISLSIL